MQESENQSLKTQQHPLLLRRPLPPKLPKLPLSRKKVRTATTHETEQSLVKLSRHASASVKIGHSVSTSQKTVSIQSISLDYYHKTPERVVSASRGAHSIHWKIPHSVARSMFIPTFLPASSQVFRNKLHQIKGSRKFKKKDKVEEVFTQTPFSNALVLSSELPKSFPASYSRRLTATLKIVTPSESRPLMKTPEYVQKVSILRDVSVSEVLLSPVPSPSSIVPEPRWAERPQHTLSINRVVLRVAALPEASILPMPSVPRKPQRQAEIENAVETGKLELPKPEPLTRAMRRREPRGYVLRGEGLKTITGTRYDTLVAMTTLAIIHCQIYGRNALNLKGFFLLNCPDLTVLAYQLVYLNLSFNNLSHFPREVFCLKNLQVLKMRNNPMRELPSDIYQLKYLRIFTIAFNFIKELPIGLFHLSFLEELDVSYNELAHIPNDIQRLRSLEKLTVDGNYHMTSFPPGILTLNLVKLQFANMFTSSHFWVENSLNDPLRLTEICSFFIVKNDLHKIYDSVPTKAKNHLRSLSRCDWCHGPKFGVGFRIIRSCNMFGENQIPILFHVCSSPCYREMKESGFVLLGFPFVRIPLNMDWVKKKMPNDTVVLL
nr:leucine-rich repeat-containing protein 63-like [Meriones unguiculatus]XP_021516677.1 leucine-rich repeat-containing protein 63-like [Meriones unguiculatus]